MTNKEAKTYLDEGGVAIHAFPQVVPGEKQTGVTAGRIVAYWPSADDVSKGLRAVGGDGFIPAMIVASWATSEDGTECPCANLKLFLDPSNHKSAIAEGRDGVSSAQYSAVPAQRSWTWIPKA